MRHLNGPGSGLEVTRPWSGVRGVSTRGAFAVAALAVAMAFTTPPPVHADSSPVNVSEMGSTNLIPFEQRYRVTADDALRDALSSRGSRTVVVEPGMTVTSIARSRNGRWLKVRIDGRAATGFIQTRHLERIAGGNADDPLAALARGSSASSDAPSSLDLGELTRSGEIERRHRRNAERRRAEAERRRIEEKLERLEKEQEERERRLAEEQERLEQERRRAEYMGNNDTSGVDWAEMALYAVDSFAESNDMLRREAQKTQRLARQAFAQKQRQIERQQREARRRQEELRRQQRAAQQRAQQQQAQRRQAEIQRQQRELQRRQAAAERERRRLARKQEAARRQAEQVAQRQREQQRLAMANNRSGSGGSSGNGSTGSGKIYEPMMETALGENDVWFSDRDLAVYYARLAAVNDIGDACTEKGARSDNPSTQQMRAGNAPAHWSFGSPQCRQGGWEDSEYACRVEVAGTCYRRR